LAAGTLQVSSLSFSKDGKLLVSVSDDNVKVWEVGAEKERNSFPVGRGNAAVISPDTSVIAVSTIGSRKYAGLNAVKLFESGTGKELTDFHCNLSASAMLFTPDGESLITTEGGIIRIRDVTTGAPRATFDGPPIN
jgi:WD40 repeat protein